jgi:hypothetical protein
VDYFVYNVLRLRGEVVKGYYLSVLKARDPTLHQRTLKLYGSRAYPSDDYIGRLQQKVAFYREKWGLKNRWREFFADGQLDLFGGRPLSP